MERFPSVVRVAIARFLQHEDVVQWLLYAASAGDHDLIRLLQYESAYPLALRRAEVISSAVATGQFRALAALLSRRRFPDDHSARAYVSSYCSARPFPAWVLETAIEKIVDEREALEVVHWLHRRTRYDVARAVQHTAQNRRLVIAQWILTNANDAGLQIVVPYEEKEVPVLHWLETTPLPDGRGRKRRLFFATTTHGLAPVRTGRCYDDAPAPVYPALDFAASVGDLQLLRALHRDAQIKWGCTTEAMDAAAGRGDLDMLQWLHLHRSEGTSQSAMDRAAANGHLEVLKWLYFMRNERGTPRAFDDAAANGHVHILKWQNARFPHFQVSTTALEQAAANGHVAVFHWITETTTSRLSVTPTMLQNAINAGHLELSQWLMEREQARGYDPRRFLASHLIARAGASGNLRLLQWLQHEYQVTSRGWLPSAAANGQVAVAKWLLSEDILSRHEVFLGTHTLFELAMRGHWDFLEWLLIHHCDLCLQCAFVPSNKPFKNAKDPKTRQEDLSLVRYTRLLLQYVPSLCINHGRLGIWAAHHAFDDILACVWDQRRDGHGVKTLLNTVIRSMATTTASRVVHGIVTKHPEYFTRRVAQWTATFAHVSLLQTLWTLTTPAKRIPLLQTTMFTACRHGQKEVLVWVRRHEKELELMGIDLWRGATDAAVRHHQRAIVQYLRKQE